MVLQPCMERNIHIVSDSDLFLYMVHLPIPHQNSEERSLPASTSEDVSGPHQTADCCLHQVGECGWQLAGAYQT